MVVFAVSHCWQTFKYFRNQRWSVPSFLPQKSHPARSWEVSPCSKGDGVVACGGGRAGSFFTNLGGCVCYLTDTPWHGPQSWTRACSPRSSPLLRQEGRGVSPLSFPLPGGPAVSQPSLRPCSTLPCALKAYPSLGPWESCSHFLLGGHACPPPPLGAVQGL